METKFFTPLDVQDREQALLAFHHEVTVLWSLSFNQNVISLIAYDDATTSIVTPLYDVRSCFLFLWMNTTHSLRFLNRVTWIISCTGPNPSY